MPKRITFQINASLRHRRNLASVSNVCEAAPISLFWAPTDLQIAGRAFRISFHPDWQMDHGISTGQSWCVLNSWYTGKSPYYQGFRRCFADRLNQSLVSSAAQANRKCKPKVRNVLTPPLSYHTWFCSNMPNLQC